MCTKWQISVFSQFLMLLSFHLILTSGPILIAKNHHRVFLVGACFLRQVLGVRSISIFAKNISDPYHEPTSWFIVNHNSGS